MPWSTPYTSEGMPGNAMRACRAEQCNGGQSIWLEKHAHVEQKVCIYRGAGGLWRVILQPFERNDRLLTSTIWRSFEELLQSYK